MHLCTKHRTFSLGLGRDLLENFITDSRTLRLDDSPRATQAGLMRYPWKESLWLELKLHGLRNMLPGWLSSEEFTWDAGDVGSIPTSGRSPGGGKGNPLQCSCLENPMDRGAWWATVHGVIKSQTRLSAWTCVYIFKYIYIILILRYIYVYIYTHIYIYTYSLGIESRNFSLHY